MSNIKVDEELLAILAEEKEKLLEERMEVISNKTYERDDKVINFTTRQKGMKPDGGYALYIGMHGGGGCEAEANDEQYENHKGIYESCLEDGSIWLAPRAPEDCWNMWFLDYIDEMFDYLIQSYLIIDEVNPNKVYITGFSAGGDGTWRLAPRMADRWAGANMSAGHPGDIKLDSCRNIFFGIQCGGQDTMYDRDQKCRDKIKEIKSLKENDPEAYDHYGEMHEEFGHWMDEKDGKIFDMLKNKVRNPNPKKIVWVQDPCVMKKSFYWLSIDEEINPNQGYCGARIEAWIEGNTINIKSDHISIINVNLNKQLVDFNEPVKILFNGEECYNDTVERNMDIVKESILKRFDPYLIYEAQILCQGNFVSVYNNFTGRVHLQNNWTDEEEIQAQLTLEGDSNQKFFEIAAEAADSWSRTFKGTYFLTILTNSQEMAYCYQVEGGMAYEFTGEKQLVVKGTEEEIEPFDVKDMS